MRCKGEFEPREPPLHPVYIFQIVSSVYCEICKLVKCITFGIHLLIVIFINLGIRIYQNNICRIFGQNCTETVRSTIQNGVQLYMLCDVSQHLQFMFWHLFYSIHRLLS